MKQQLASRGIVFKASVLKNVYIFIRCKCVIPGRRCDSGAATAATTAKIEPIENMNAPRGGGEDFFF